MPKETVKARNYFLGKSLTISENVMTVTLIEKEVVFLHLTWAKR